MARGFVFAMWLAAGIGLLGAESVFAGPIGWSYTAELQIDPSSRPDYAPALRQPTGSYDTVLRPDRWGEEGIWLVTIDLGPTAYPAGNPSSGQVLDINDQYSVRFSITDEASGQTGTVNLGGAYESHWFHRPDSVEPWDWIASYSDFGPHSQELILGRNRYEVAAWGNESRGDVAVIVEPLPGVPEPATLSLAALGLAGAGAVRRLRRNRA